jgi:hypothetical protein
MGECRKTSKDGEEVCDGRRSLLLSPMSFRLGTHRVGFLDIDARLSNPRVRIQLADNRVGPEHENHRRVGSQ